MSLGANSPYQLEQIGAGIPIAAKVGISGAGAELISPATAAFALSVCCVGEGTAY
jgi:hypothetical protein